MPQGVIWWILGGAFILVLFFALNTCRHVANVATVSETPQVRLDRLSAYWQIVRPEGPGPHPAAVLLSGCDGVRDNMVYWANRFAEAGRIALILDSHTPRGLDKLESWRLVCAGQALPGFKRAGDLAVVLHALEADENVTGDVVVFGASHGGWTAMEFVAQAASGVVPPGLTEWPAPPEDLLGQVAALVLLYPYCGLLNRADEVTWPADLPALMVLAEEDSIVDTDACLSMANTLGKSGADIRAEVIPGADHGFDQREKSLLSSLSFNAEQRAEAHGFIETFLTDVKKRE